MACFSFLPSFCSSVFSVSALQVKKGMSLDQKREETLRVFTESCEFFNAKEVIALASKRGVTSQTVKDVLQSLVDDNLVTTDKVGISNYYWAFPATVGQKRKAQIAGLEESLQVKKKRKIELDEENVVLEAEREETATRVAQLAELDGVRAEIAKVDTELERFAECNPETVEALEKKMVVAKDAANRWTDNMYSLRSHVETTFGMDREMLNERMEITEAFDYVE
eukprot:c14670_g1_i2.p1 GENE.c14670_g1_i2~~c14670_g1_i2.p1  ORF type:complete len:224 (+),score=62.45 c14670_g1_i2:284-955(+)